MTKGKRPELTQAELLEMIDQIADLRRFLIRMRDQKSSMLQKVEEIMLWLLNETQ